MGTINQPPVFVTGEREARLEYWYAIRVQSCCERKLQAILIKQGVESYIAEYEELRQWSDRKVKKMRIIIPSIVFVKIHEKRIPILFRNSYVLNIMHLPGENIYAKIPDNQIRQLKLVLEDFKSKVTIDNHLPMGRIVRVVDGPLKGAEGVVCSSEYHDTTIGLRIGTIGCAYVSIDAEILQPINKT